MTQASLPEVQGDDPRTDELRANLTAVRRRMAEAEEGRQVGAGPAQLIAVTKFFPAQDVRRLLSLGVTDVGENRDQEASAKALEVPRARWHFVGQLQSKKSNSVVRYASRVHSVDRASLVTALGKAVRNHRSAVEEGRAQPGPSATTDLECLIQISLDGTSGRGGALPEDIERIADRIAEEEGLRLRGVMAVAPLGADPEPAFERLYGCATELQAAHPHADHISAGMSADLEAAVRWGSTHVRVGSGILGARPVG
ncbi:YggS family pyridoxal phosphate-dependent enzyme [Kocuria coralli]|uniref:Pyridoxal phosphate homeostasis protein n=1 Tax=Kocuria coralli TaxID=1461025 RepID=A0A5J5KYA9_9MICC|nr:YggS family pyridoxal phosphate-dependent enzyme [Kocuria coralli]KAA9394418.1 YggS family pyridoxal phosphate-dependent enzyme [Kocuria coralli]